MTEGGQDRRRIAGQKIDFSVLTHAVGYQVRRAQLAIFQDFNETFANDGLRPADFAVLVIISANPGLKQSEVAEALGIQRANFVAIADSLESRGLAERRKSESDRRVQALFLTERGERFAADMIQTWRGHDDRLVQKLGGTAERDRLIALLTKFYD
jgi:DNA-binding MarR family transcriptional regulator